MNDRTQVCIQPVTWQTHAEALTALRHAVFVHEQGVPAEMEVDADDPHATHFAALTDAGTCVATGRLTRSGKIGRMAVASRWRGCGLGGDLLQRIIQAAQHQQQTAVYLDAQITAQAFYERHGFIAEGEVFEDAGLPHIRMRKPLDLDSGKTAATAETQMAAEAAD